MGCQHDSLSNIRESKGESIMKLFENITNSIYQTNDSNFEYTLACDKQTNDIVLLPKILHRVDKKLMEAIRQDLSRERFEDNGDMKLLWKIIDNYETLADSGVYERKIIASINLLSTLFSVRNNEIFNNHYGMALNKLLASGHYAGLYFEAVTLMCSDSEEVQCRGCDLMSNLIENGNPFALKRRELLYEIGYPDFCED